MPSHQRWTIVISKVYIWSTLLKFMVTFKFQYSKFKKKWFKMPSHQGWTIVIIKVCGQLSSNKWLIPKAKSHLFSILNFFLAKLGVFSEISLIFRFCTFFLAKLGVLSKISLFFDSELFFRQIRRFSEISLFFDFELFLLTCYTPIAPILDNMDTSMQHPCSPGPGPLRVTVQIGHLHSHRLYAFKS